MPTTTAPTTATTSTQMQTTGFTATAMPVTMDKLATGQFAEASSPAAKPQNGGHSSVQNFPPLEDMPKTPVRQGTPWPNAGSENLFETKKDWPIPPTPVPASAPTVKTEAPSKVSAIPRVMDAPRQAAKNYTWGPHCPICKNEEHGEEDWDGNLQNQPRMHPPKPSSAGHTKPSAAKLPKPTATNPSS